MNAHEAGVLEFVAEPQRQRMRTLLELSEKRRATVRALLDHSVRLDPRYAERLSGSEQSTAGVLNRLRRLGAPADCRVLSSSADLDGREMSLGAALAAVIGSGHGTFISCMPGTLGYFEAEDVGSGHVLHRPFA